MKKQDGLRSLEVAKSELTQAAAALDAALLTLKSEPRANKVTVSAAVCSALEKLNHARAVLSEFERDAELQLE